MRSILLLLPFVLLAAETPARKAPAPARKPVAEVTAKNFKQSGSPTAPISIEVYTDYQCPSCRALYMETIPQLIKDYVMTGKVRLLHRDFPLQMHQFGALAARYANAAGQLGHYDAVVNQIFKTQPEWAQNGNIEAQVAKVLPAAEMQKIKEIIKNDSHLDDTVKADVDMATKDGVTETPTLEIVVRNGSRQKIGGFVAYPILRSYINQLLAKG